MLEFLKDYWSEILLAVVTTGAIGFCKYLYNKVKNYRTILEGKETDELNEVIDNKIEPILNEIEELRSYMRKARETEQTHVDLIVSSYRSRLVQLCQIYIKQKYLTQDQYDQLTEFYKVYVGFGGNGQAKEYYEKAISLPIQD